MGTNLHVFFSSIVFFLVLVNGFWMGEMEKRIVTSMQLFSPWMDLVCIENEGTGVLFWEVICQLN